MAKPEFVKHRCTPAKDYTGAHVSMTHEGRTYLGTITALDMDEAMCEVRHFNGERWPFYVALRRLDIIERTYCAICGASNPTEDDVCDDCRTGQLVHMAEMARE